MFGDRLMSLVIISQGIVALILSFGLQDKNKARLSYILSALILTTGFFQFGKQYWEQRVMTRQFNRNLEERRADIEAMRNRIREQAEGSSTPRTTGSPAERRP